MIDRAAATGLERPDADPLPSAAADPFAPDRAEDTGTIYYLAIFLLLLAFFILLGAIARLDEVKTRGVMTSVAATFRTDADAGDYAEIFVSRLGTIPEPAVLLEGLEGLWLTALPVTRVEVLQPGRTMELSLPLREMFVGRTAALRSDRQALLEHTVAALAVPVADQALRLSMFSGQEASPRPGETALAFERAVALAGALQDLGPAPTAFAVGLDPSSVGRIRLRFAFRDRDATAADPGAGPAGTAR